MPGTQLLNAASEALAGLRPDLQALGIEPLGQGHINDTLLVTFAAGAEPRRGVLQRLNRDVFPAPEQIMANLALLADHLEIRLVAQPLPAGERWGIIRSLAGRAGGFCFQDQSGSSWRLITYVPGAETLEQLHNAGQAREAGRVLGLFHRLVADLEPGRLFDTLPGFHVTPTYLSAYDRLERRGPDSADEAFCRQVIETHRQLAPVLEEAARQSRLRPRVIHGDPRLANMLFDRISGRAVALIDLDTVKPGLLHYDLGDCLRSCCNPAGDDPGDPAEVRFELETCRAVLAGYLAEAGRTLSGDDFALIYPALRLMAFELGLRFFSDHLAGDRYFRATGPGHNLRRARVQFRLLAEIEAREAEIRRLIEACRAENAA